MHSDTVPTIWHRFIRYNELFQKYFNDKSIICSILTKFLGLITNDWIWMWMTTEIEKSQLNIYALAFDQYKAIVLFSCEQTNCEEQDQTRQNVAPDQDLHCLNTELSIKSCSEMINTSQQSCKWKRTKDKTGHILFGFRIFKIDYIRYSYFFTIVF